MRSRAPRRGRRAKAGRRPVFFPQEIVRSEIKILFGKIGQLKDDCDDDNGAHDAPNNELMFDDKNFVIRNELSATQLKNDVSTLTVFTFSIVVENEKECLYLAYRPGYLERDTDMRHFDRVVRTFFISNKDNALDLLDYEADHFAVEEIQQIENVGDAHVNDDNVENGVANEDDATIGGDMVSELYHRLRKAHFEHDQLVTVDAPVQHASMSATLKSYQAAAVRWMLHRELCHTEASLCKPVFRRWPPVNDDSAGNFFYNPCTFRLSHGQPDFPSIELPSGGILADEMGLGKTVEALSLILLNKRPQSDLMGGLDPNDAEYECIEIPDSDDDDLIENNGRYMDDDEEDCDDYESNIDDDDDCDESPQAKRRRMARVSVKCICQSSKSIARHFLIQCTKCALRQHRLCVLRHVVGKVDSEKYICPQCWNKEEMIKTTATIIVSPRSIKMQWFHEVQKHIKDDNFKVLVYDGIKGANWISPIDLAAYDVILADYETMISEMKFVNASQVHRVQRAPPRYIKPTSPLLKVDWWRVCLDEAQMVQSGVTIAARLVGQLTTTHRWAITGTPIDKSVNDLCGLFRFLGFEKNRDLRWAYERYTSGESDELIEELWPIMWRTCKTQDILDEIDIPKQTEIVHFITPSDLELYFYNEQFVSCFQAFQEKADMLAAQQQRLSDLNPHVLKLLMEPLRKIRQDCSMPSVLQKTDQRINKNLLRPDDLLQHLISNTEIKAKTELRTIGSSLNGLAALHIGEKNYDAAIAMYKKVLKWAAEYTGNISVDSLLQVHALHNLLTIGSNLAQEERDKYAEQLKLMEQKYIEPSAQLVAKIKSDQKKYTDRVDECRENFVVDEYTWWAAMLANSEDGRSDQVMVRIFSELMETEAFSNARGLSLALTKWMDAINADRDGVYKLFEKLTYFTDNLKALPMLEPKEREKIQKLIDRALDCHLDPHGGRRVRNQRKQQTIKLCELCEAKQQLEQYERSIQPVKKNDTKIDRSKERQPTKKEWKLSQMETILRILHMQARQFDLSEDLQNDSKNHLKLMEALHSEFTELSQLWVEVNHTVSLYDEIEMCKSRLVVYDPLEIEMQKLPGNIANLYVSKYEVADTMLTHQDQIKQAELEFVRKMGRLKYLNHLKKSDVLENCPICCQPPEEKYVVLECGHHMCMVCGVKWMETTTAGLLTCSICRHQQRKKSLYYVTLRPNKKLTDSSSKIEEIVQTIIKLKEDDELVKIVIFSHWPDILNILERALVDNKIEYRSRMSAFSTTLSQFKNPSLNVTCLLLPLKCGAKGLNLTEATHVFLLEPILNPGEQLQAIGRIHRMGQTRPTFVHRFIMKNTIEETIHEQSKCDMWAFKNWTIENLRKLFRGKDN